MNQLSDMSYKLYLFSQVKSARFLQNYLFYRCVNICLLGVSNCK